MHSSRSTTVESDSKPTESCLCECVVLQSAMPVLAAAAKRLRGLNLSWLAMVNDWGLGQLSSLVHLEDLNLRATGGSCVDQGVRGSGSLGRRECLGTRGCVIVGFGADWCIVSIAYTIKGSAGERITSDLCDFCTVCAAPLSAWTVPRALPVDELHSV